MQATGDLVGTAAELSTGMEGGHHRFQGTLPSLRVFVYWDTAAVVDHFDPTVLGYGNLHPLAESGHGFVNCVV